MTNYSIKIIKGEIEYSLSSQDEIFVSDYIDSFFQELKKESKPFEHTIMPKLYAEKTLTSQLQETKIQNPIEVEEKELETQTTEINPQDVNGLDIDEKKQEKTIDEMVKSLFEKSAEDTIININSNAKENKKDENKEDLSSLTTLLAPKYSLEETNNGDFNFDSILEDKITNPVYEEQETKQFNYDELLKMKQPDSSLDYLIITAYYMLENENIESFQLKQLNAKLFNSMNMVVDRKTIQKAIEDGLVTVVSDGIQNDGAVEYALTRAGQEFYTNGLA